MTTLATERTGFKNEFDVIAHPFRQEASLPDTLEKQKAFPQLALSVYAHRRAGRFLAGGHFTNVGPARTARGVLLA